MTRTRVCEYIMLTQSSILYQVVRIRFLRHAGTHYWFEHPVEDGTTESDNDMSDSLLGDLHARKIRAVL